MNDEKTNKIMSSEELDDVLPKYEPIKLSGRNLAQNYVSAFNTGMNIYQCVNYLQGNIDWTIKAVNDVVKSWNTEVSESINQSKAIVRETTTEQFNTEWTNKQPQLIEQVNTLTTNQFNEDWGVLENRINTTLETQNTNIETIQNNQNELETNTNNNINVQNTKINSIQTQQTNLASEQTTLSNRMDTFTSLSEGSTTGDAELKDIRVGANGVTYNNAGAAVRGQYSQLKEDLESYGNFVNMFDESDFEVGNKYIDSEGHIVSELSRKDRISTITTVYLNSGCEIYTTTDNIKIIIYKKSSDIYTFADDTKTKNQKIKIEDSGDYLIVIGVLPEKSKEINHVNELLSYCYYTFEPYNVIEKIDDSLYTTYYTSNSNLIVKTLDEINHYAYYRVPRQINYGEKISVTIKSNSMNEQLPVNWNIITCNGFGEKYIDDTCGIQRQSYPSSLNMINEQYDIEVKRDFTYIGLYIHDSKTSDFELTISFKKSTAQSIQKDNILTVMTYNADRFSLVNANEEMHSIILEKYGVDIVGIQEYRDTINNNSIFTNVFTDYKYHHENSIIPNPSGIVSKKKLFSTHDYLFTHQSRDEESPTEYVEIRGYTKSYIYVNGKKICWLNTHIDLNEETRYLQLEELRNIMLSEEYAILTGDLNTSKIIDSTSVEWKNAIKPFLDAGLKCANNNDIYGYNWTWADLNFIKTAKVDNIIVTPNIDFVDVVFDKTRMDYINSTDVPEHNPIIVKLRVN